MNLYLSSCIQYFALAAVTAFCGAVPRKLTVTRAKDSAGNLPYGLQKTPDVIDTEAVEAKEDDFETWGWGTRNDKELG